MKHYDYIIIGSGLFGAVFAQQAREAGKSVLIVEKRAHIGGNCYSYDYEDTNITVHQYGTHIFHTNNDEIWRYINRFTVFNRYQHRVLTTYQNKVYPMPICLGTINAFYNLNLKPAEVDAFIESKRGNIENPQNLEEKAISLIGRDLYEAFIRGYTMKQWGCDPKELPASIITRLPVRKSYHDSYFDDRYQGIPVGGYTPIFERLLGDTPVDLNTDFFDDPDYWRARCDTLIYTGPIDRYFNYQHGRLNWRSVRFETERLDVDDYQGTSVMNYADLDVPFTRIHEPRHLHLEKTHRPPDATVIIREYSQVNNDAPYYPVNAPADKKLLALYQELAEREENVIFGGRLAEYKYYDMHQVIGSALKKAKETLLGSR
jgi:UDP-galactopyranose mutase